jgi:hypothetical protein
MNYDIESPVKQAVNRVENQIKGRAYQASHELRTAVLYVLRGQRSGRRYRVPYTLGKGRTPSGRKRTPRYYTASAPGEAPAVLTGGLRNSYWPNPRATKAGNQLTVSPAITSPLPRARLDIGYGRATPRPYAERTKARALPAIQAIYKRKYL